MRWRSWGVGFISRFLVVENSEGERIKKSAQGWWGLDVYGGAPQNRVAVGGFHDSCVQRGVFDALPLGG